MKIVFTLPGVILFASCAVTPPAELSSADGMALEEDAGHLIETYALTAHETTQAADSLVAPAHRVRVPRSAPWLSEALQARYHDLPASAVITLLAQSHPVRLTFAPLVDPGVRPPADAITVKDHLDAVCGQADWSYTVAHGVVLIHDMETKTFPLASQPGESAAQMPLRGLVSESEGATRNQVSVSLDPYADEIKALVQGVLGLGRQEGSDERGGVLGQVLVDPRTRVTVLPSANSVVVTAKPHQMRQVEKVLAQYNEASAKTVRLHIALFEVDVFDSKSRSLSLSALRAGANTFGARITPSTGQLDDAGVLSVTFNQGNAYDSSEAVFRWLNTLGKTSLTFEDAMEIRNNAVGSVDATQTRQYVSRISRETQIAGATQLETPTVEFDELRTGWALHVQPTIVGDTVTVRIGLSRSAFVDEEPFSFDEGRIAGTNFITDDYNRLMAVALKHGETKLLTSLSSGEARQAKKRTPWLPWLGDDVSSANRQRETVMMMTAHVL